MVHRLPAILSERGINHGVNFERACEQLSHVAGYFFRRYIELKRTPGASAEDRTAARNGYLEAQRRCEELQPESHEEIARILSGAT